jgi:hypothetical protein
VTPASELLIFACPECEHRRSITVIRPVCSAAFLISAAEFLSTEDEVGALT